MRMELKYAHGYKAFDLPDGADVTVLRTRDMPVVPDVRQALYDALEKPADSASPARMAPPESVAIAVPDETRPTPLKALLPPLLEYLFSVFASLGSKDVSIVVGGGLHAAADEGQLRRILPDEAFACRVVSHDAAASPMASYGTTSRGTPVEINAEYAAAGLKIVVGQVDPHQFVGFTGGCKGVAIGLASKAMIRHNHSLMSLPGACVGGISGNPVRQDIEEAGRMIGIDLAVNVVLNPDRRIVTLLAGTPDGVLRRGAEVAARVHGFSCPEPFDLVIASCGGNPKDICLYQAQKGLHLASRCAREGGKILLLAACGQGVGDSRYYEYVRRFSSPKAQLEEFEAQGFRMGAHKAFLFSRTVTRYDVTVVSELDEATLASCHLVKGSLQDTLDRWLAELPAHARIGVVPSANTTFFYTPAFSCPDSGVRREPGDTRHE